MAGLQQVAGVQTYLQPAAVAGATVSHNLDKIIVRSLLCTAMSCLACTAAAWQVASEMQHELALKKR